MKMKKAISHQLIKEGNKDSGIFLQCVFITERIMMLGPPPPAWRLLARYRYNKRVEAIRGTCHEILDKHLEEKPRIKPTEALA